jgi:RNA polymerase sigma-70 factor (ECF subfamily)
MNTHHEITGLLVAAGNGEPGAAQELLPIVYGELHRRAVALMRRERSGHTLQATALVHDAYLELVDRSGISWAGRSHFYALSAQTMRRILVDHARRRARLKRGGARNHSSLDDGMPLAPTRAADVLALDAALDQLARLDPRQAQIVEMRFFGGLSMEEVADALGVCKRSVESEWTMIKAWLRRELGEA